MFKQKITEIKDLIVKNKNGNNKKNIENLAVFLVLLIITLIAINTIWKDNQTDDDVGVGLVRNTSEIDPTPPEINEADTIVKSDLEKNLENILSKINGVGKVDVLITYYESSEVVAMYDENVKESKTEETDTNGGTRVTEQKDTDKSVIYTEENGVKIPVTGKIITPKISGAIVIAKGAGDINVKNKVTEAIVAVTGLAMHRIQVYEMGEEIQ